jgi:hypothetical protein
MNQEDRIVVALRDVLDSREIRMIGWFDSCVVLFSDSSVFLF